MVERRDRTSSKPGFLCCMMPVISPSAQGHIIDPGIQKLLSSLGQIRSRSGARDDDVKFLQGYFKSEDFMSLLKVHERMADWDNQDPKSVADDALEISSDVSDYLQCHPFSSESFELHKILVQPHMKALLCAHDLVAQKQYGPSLPEIPHEVDEDDHISVKIVRLLKQNEPLGATIKIVENGGAVLIARVMHGGAADRCGLIHAGDEVIEVNGISKDGNDPQAFVDILTSIAGPLTIKLVPANEVRKQSIKESKMIVRTFFSYDPLEDKLIPCKEAGLAFKSGEILHIVNQDDPLWWQARVDRNSNSRTGLIPSRQMQENKEATKNKKSGIPISKSKGAKNGFFSRTLKRTKKSMYHCTDSEAYDGSDIRVYEEVQRYLPADGFYRPIVLIGPPGVGRNELTRRLIAKNPNHFKSTVPHTSRPRKPHELDGSEYLFVTKEEMERGIIKKKFIEHGEFEGNLYGTSYDQVMSIIQEQKVCIISPHPQALKYLRTAELKPYVIFIKPPDIDTFWDTRTSNQAVSSYDENSIRQFTNEEISEVILIADKYEAKYKSFFDEVIVNDYLHSATEQLTTSAFAVENEPQWVPVNWCR